MRVGEKSLVAAGALVSPGTIIPPRSLVIGVPAKVKRELTEEELAALVTRDAMIGVAKVGAPRAADMPPN